MRCDDDPPIDPLLQDAPALEGKSPTEVSLGSQARRMRVSAWIGSFDGALLRKDGTERDELTAIRDAAIRRLLRDKKSAMYWLMTPLCDCLEDFDNAFKSVGGTWGRNHVYRARKISA